MTNPDSNIEEILYYAISREIEANVFYNLLSQYIDDEKVKAVCNEFAMEELGHKAQLELEIMKLGRTVRQTAEAKQSSRTLPKPLDYMLNMVRFMQMALPELLLFAMEKEKISFRLYIDLLATIHDEQSRQTILEIAEEEARHKMRFELEYDRLMASQQEPPA
ncbi:MAG: ferritin family protein [Sedimentisphaerales bacterium]